MIHPDTELQFISPAIGYGVVALKRIPKGTITWVLDKLDREFTPDEVQALDPLYQDILDKYCFRNNKGNMVLCWDNSRFVNHSFNSNCLTTAYDFEIAIRDIEAGEQLTDDYGYLNISEPFEAMPEESDRTVVYPDDLLRYHKEWDRQLNNAMKTATQVPQPLKNLLSRGQWQTVVNIVEGREEMASILNCYYEER